MAVGKRTSSMGILNIRASKKKDYGSFSLNLSTQKRPGEVADLVASSSLDRKRKRSLG